MEVPLYVNHMYHQRRCARGYVTLLSVLILGAVGLALVVSALQLGISSSRAAFALEQSNQAKALANACAEEAMGQIRGSNSFSGTFALTFSTGSCTYTVTNTGGQTRTITATGTVGTMVRKVRVTIDKITPSINVTSWQEVADF